MDVYFVKPNLQILSCDSCPTEENLVTKKSVYLSLLNKCSQLRQLSGNESAIPTWCTDDPHNSSDATSSSSTSSVESLNTLNTLNKSKSPKTSSTSKTCLRDNQNGKKDWVSDIMNFPLQSVRLTQEDCYRQSKITNSILFTRLNIPTNIPSVESKWLALKYLQLSADVAFLQYKYLKSYTKINKLVKRYFSKPDISESDEAKGFRCISYEMNKFKALENVLTLLTHLQDKFQACFSHIGTANTLDAPAAALTQASPSSSGHTIATAAAAATAIAVANPQTQTETQALTQPQLQ